MGEKRCKFARNYGAKVLNRERGAVGLLASAQHSASIEMN